MMCFFCSFITRGKTLDSVPRHGQGQIQLIAASTTQQVWLMQHYTTHPLSCSFGFIFHSKFSLSS